MKTKKILFVCKYNAFRSRVAEEYFNKVNTGRRIRTISRGIIMGGNSDSVQRRIAKSLLGVNISKRKPLPLTLQNMKDADLIFIVANDLPRIIFNYRLPPIQKKLTIWNVKDEQNMNQANIRKIILIIKRKVDELDKEFEKEK